MSDNFLLEMKAIEAACRAYEASPCMDFFGPMEAAISAYRAEIGKDDEQHRHGRRVMELIERLSNASEGSWELDAEIEALTHVSSPYTTSIDAALTLVKEGLAWSLSRMITTDAEAIVFGHELHTTGHAATPAIALCIAALKARDTGREAMG